MNENQKRRAWQTLYLTQVGSRHEVQGVECQDAAAAVRLGDTLYLAVADGAGSERLSGIGSKTAVCAALNWLKDHAPSPTDPNWPDVFRRGLSFVQAALVQQAGKLRVRVEELSTTLLFAVVTPEHAIAAHVGDGACVLRIADSGYRTLCAAKRNGFANETEFVTERHSGLELRLTVYRGRIRGVVAFSDGLEAGALAGGCQPHAGFLDPLFGWCSAESLATGRKRISEFLRSDHLRAHTDDDCSLVIAQVVEE